MVNKDTLNFIKSARCLEYAYELANNISTYSGPPSEEEILSRCRYVMEYIVTKSFELSGLSQVEFEIEIDDVE